MPCQSFLAAISLWFMDYFCLSGAETLAKSSGWRHGSDLSAKFSTLRESGIKPKNTINLVY